MSENITSIRNMRRPKGTISSLGTNYLHLRNPWVTAWWSLLFPGFGHILLGSYLKGFAFILLELILNIGGKINLGIMYSLTGQFHMAKQVIDPGFAFLYLGVFTYAIWGSYRSTVDLNKFSILADREDSPILPANINSLDMNFFDKRNPWMAVICSTFFPGLGHLYIQRVITGYAIMTLWVTAFYFSNIAPAFIYIVKGSLTQASALLDPQWFLFLPSTFGFAIYDAYVQAVEHNRLFEIEQSRFLKDNYQKPDFKLKRTEVA